MLLLLMGWGEAAPPSPDTKGDISISDASIYASALSDVSVYASGLSDATIYGASVGDT
jgi:hypothetical protein